MRNAKLFLKLLPLLAGLLGTQAIAEVPVDRIVAVVEDNVILASELQQKLAGLKRNLAQSNTQLPPDAVLARQVLERMIMDKIQVTLAEKAGIRIDDESLRLAVQQIAQRNNMTPEELRASLKREGMEYADLVEQIRNEMAVQRLRAGQVNSQIKISDREVQHWLDTQGKSGVSSDSEFLLGHILIATPQAASPAAVQKAKEKADRLVADLKKGQDFKQASIASSDSDQALSGGELGWRKLSQVPTLFAELVPKMQRGDIEGPIRSPSGFHIIKLLGVKGGGVAQITKTHVRHILIKPNEVLSDDEARKKLLALKSRIEAGDDFAVLARGHSDDKGSAIKGGDLGLVTQGALVPEFEEAMNHLAINELSEPVQTQYGWHLIQVLERQESTDADELLKKQARDEIFKRKVEEETELWMRRIRDEAYVEIRLAEPAPESFIPR
jgi:peptidyl-prolyl cis-trans isomerase SurA